MKGTCYVDVSPLYMGCSVKGGFNAGVVVGKHILSNTREEVAHVYFPPTLKNISFMHAKGIVETIRNQIGWNVDLYSYVNFIGRDKVVAKLDEAYY